jgi:hypothetical protein
MPDREVRVSPDGQAVAIKTDRNPEGNQAWGVIHFEHGGSWVPMSSVADWTPVNPA